jgi:hypothetical protein
MMAPAIHGAGRCSSMYRPSPPPIPLPPKVAGVLPRTDPAELLRWRGDSHHRFDGHREHRGRDRGSGDQHEQQRQRLRRHVDDGHREHRRRAEHRGKQVPAARRQRDVHQRRPQPAQPLRGERCGAEQRALRDGQPWRVARNVRPTPTKPPAAPTGAMRTSQAAGCGGAARGEVIARNVAAGSRQPLTQCRSRRGKREGHAVGCCRSRPAVHERRGPSPRQTIAPRRHRRRTRSPQPGPRCGRGGQRRKGAAMGARPGSAPPRGARATPHSPATTRSRRSGPRSAQASPPSRYPSLVAVG